MVKAHSTFSTSSINLSVFFVSIKFVSIFVLMVSVVFSSFFLFSRTLLVWCAGSESPWNPAFLGPSAGREFCTRFLGSQKTCLWNDEKEKHPQITDFGGGGESWVLFLWLNFWLHLTFATFIWPNKFKERGFGVRFPEELPYDVGFLFMKPLVAKLVQDQQQSIATNKPVRLLFF